MLNKAIAHIHQKTEQEQLGETELNTTVTSFHALLTNGCQQIQIHHKAQNEHLFHLYLQAHYPYYICLYASELSK